MRNKQAKALRQQARQSGAAEQTTYIMEVYNKQYFDVLTGKLKGYKAYTKTLDLCQRSVYQALKNEFKRKA
jgi:hypothetical protein